MGKLINNLHKKTLPLSTSFMLLLMSYSVIYAQYIPPETEWKMLNLFGNVQEIQSKTTVNALYGPTSNTRLIISDTITFDTMGHILEERSWQKKSNSSDIDWKYYRTIYTYDKQGNRTSILKYEDNRIENEIHFSYDSNSWLTVQKWFDNQGQLDISKVYTYDETGRLLNMKLLNADQNLSTIEQYVYNEAGQVIEFNEKIGTLSSKTIYRYNVQGQKVEALLYVGNDSIPSKEIFEYNKHGQLIRTMLYRGINHDRLSEQITYDDKGNIESEITIEHPSNKKTVFKTVYTFDAQGNWTSMKTFRNDTLNTSVIRNITYFD